MANKVFANGEEIACKAGSGKSIAAFPDVCLSPPSPPAGPIPIPYPLTAMDSDTTDGSKHVKISGKEVMLKSDSSFKKCTGDEAATKSLGMGVVTHNITGKVYFCAWSMDVKIEGANAVRNLDMVTHNHASPVGQTPPWPFNAQMAMAKGLKSCEKDIDKAKEACTEKDSKPPKWKKGAPCPSDGALQKAKAATRATLAKIRARFPAKMTKAQEAQYEAAKENSRAYQNRLKKQKREYQNYAKKCARDDCQRALKCILVPYEHPEHGKMCCASQTPHHLCDVSTFTESGGRKEGKRLPGAKRYDDKAAPCICAEGSDNNTGSHGLLHLSQREFVNNNPRNPWTKKDAIECGKAAVADVFPASACSPDCIEAQLKRGHKKVSDTAPLRAKPSGSGDADFKSEWDKVQNDLKQPQRRGGRGS